MLKSIIAAIIPFAVFYLFLGLMAFANICWQHKVRRRNRRSPLTKNMLRTPGESLRREIDELEIDHRAFLALAFAFPFILLSFTLFQVLLSDLSEPVWLWVAFAIGTFVAVAWLLKRIYGIKERIRRATLGMEGEIATGEELNQLMLSGCHVFHDIPFDYGNIDHVVISRSGVFSVETKTLSKENESGSHKATVDFTKNVVQFSDRNWRLPLDQLETNARWLSLYLTKSTGNDVKVEPMLALPGYFIKKRVGKGSVFVFNPTQPKKFFVNSRVVLDPEQIQRIAHQVDQLCRNVEPSFQANRRMG